MVDIVYRFARDGGRQRPDPTSPDEARLRLEAGNQAFAEVFAAPEKRPCDATIIPVDLDVLAGRASMAAPKQTPFAVVLGCSDARVPTELVFGQSCNNLFVVRVAGNVLGSECLGSIDYALAHMQASIRIVVVLGHTACGAVSAAVDAFITPKNYLELASSHALRAVVNHITIGVRAAVRGLETVYGDDVARRAGYRQALIHTTVVVQAALMGHTLDLEFQRIPTCEVRFGVYDLATHLVGLPVGAAGVEKSELLRPPASHEEFITLVTSVVSGEGVRRLLAAADA
jgi:carbonic anhydrase